MAFLDAAILSRTELPDVTPVLASAVAVPLCIEYCEVGSGWVPSYRPDMHCLIFPTARWPVRLTAVRDGIGREIRLDEGMLAVSRAETVISWRWEGPLSAVLVWIEPAALRSFISDEAAAGGSASGLFERQTLTDPELCGIAEQIRRALHNGGLGSEIVLEALANIFMVVLARNHGVAAEIAPPGRLTPDQFRAAVDHIHAHLGERITVPDIAAAAGTSASRLTKAMRDSVGAAPAEFVQRLRLRAARRMMCDPALALKEIAAACGFADQAHLSRLFKKRYGLPPRVFRSRVQAFRGAGKAVEPLSAPAG